MRGLATSRQNTGHPERREGPREGRGGQRRGGGQTGGSAWSPATLVGQGEPVPTTYECRVDHLAATDDGVLTERLDTLAGPGANLPIPAMGAFEVRDGRIVAWRDYFDSALIQKMGGGQDVSALVP